MYNILTYIPRYYIRDSYNSVGNTKDYRSISIIKTELQQSIMVTSSEKEQKNILICYIGMSTSVGIQCMESWLTDYSALLLLQVKIRFPGIHAVLSWDRLLPLYYYSFSIVFTNGLCRLSQT